MRTMGHRKEAAATWKAGEDDKGCVVDCAVCGDKSQWKHYGVFTCEGCKSFFQTECPTKP